MRRTILVSLALCAATATSVAAQPFDERPTGAVTDFNPAAPGLHDYAPPTPVGRGHGNAYLGAGYLEYLYSGSGARPPSLPPRRVYVGPVETEPDYGNRRLQLHQGMSSRAGIYLPLPEDAALPPW